MSGPKNELNCEDKQDFRITGVHTNKVPLYTPKIPTTGIYFSAIFKLQNDFSPVVVILNNIMKDGHYIIETSPNVLFIFHVYIVLCLMGDLQYPENKQTTGISIVTTLLRHHDICQC